jgi:hypothetical protein
VTVFAWYTNDHNGQSVAMGDDRLQQNESRRVSSYQHAGLDRSLPGAHRQPSRRVKPTEVSTLPPALTAHRAPVAEIGQDHLNLVLEEGGGDRNPARLTAKE